MSPLHEFIDDQPIVLPIDVEVDAEAHEMVVIHADQVGRDQRAVLRVLPGRGVVHLPGRDGFHRVDPVGTDTNLDLSPRVEGEIEQVIVIPDFRRHAHDEFDIGTALMRVRKEFVVAPQRLARVALKDADDILERHRLAVIVGNHRVEELRVDRAVGARLQR